MNRHSRICLGLVLVAPFLATGCGVPKRFVTTQAWMGNSADVLYVAHVEAVGGFSAATSTAKVIKCSRRADNSLDCTDQEALNTVLNRKQ